MNTNSWIKETKVKFLGIKIYEKLEKCTEQNYSSEVIQVNVSPEYYNDEFKVDKSKDNNC